MMKIIEKLRTFTGKYRGAAYSICDLKFNISHGIPAVFNSDSNYDYNFIKKELVNNIEGQPECLMEIREK